MLSLIAVASAISGRPLTPMLAIAALAALTAHAALIFSAALAAGIARFIVSVWPAVTTAVLFASTRRSTKRPSSAPFFY